MLPCKGTTFVMRHPTWQYPVDIEKEGPQFMKCDNNGNEPEELTVPEPPEDENYHRTSTWLNYCLKECNKRNQQKLNSCYNVQFYQSELGGEFTCAFYKKEC